MGSNPSVNPQIQEPKKWPQLLALVLAVFAFLFFGGGYYLNQKFLKEEASAFAARAPMAGQKYWITGQELFRFDWQGRTSEDDLLEVSRDSDFRDLVMVTPGPRSPLLTDKIPGEGDYYYRIIRRTESDSVVVLPAIRFTVVTKSPPQLIYPFGAMNSQEGKVMRFYWQAKHGVAKYRFQVSFDKSFANLLSDFVVEETQTAPQNLPVGEFYWRIRGEEDAKSFTQWTEPRRLTIEKPGSLAANPLAPAAKPAEPSQPPVAAFTAPPLPVAARNDKPTKPDPKALAAPTIEKSSQKVILKFKAGGSGRNIASEGKTPINPPSLVWGKIKGSKTYDVQVSSKADFSKIEWSKSIAKNQAYWDAARPGRYYWRVRANDNTGAKSEFSNAASLEISLPAPAIKKSITHSIKVKNRAELSAPTSVPLTWDRVPGAFGYKLIVADNESFLPAKVDMKVDRNSAQISLTEGGSYFVKVAALGNDGEPVSEYSKVSTLKFDKRAPAAATPTPAKVAAKKTQATPEPRAAEPAPVKEEIAIPRPKLPPNGVSLVSLNGTQDPILFKWEAVEKAEMYRLEIATDEEFKSITHSTVSRENQVVVTKLLPKGKNYWRVRAEQGTSKSDWSQAFVIEK